MVVAYGIGMKPTFAAFDSPLLTTWLLDWDWSATHENAKTAAGVRNGRRKNGLQTAIESRQLRKKPITEYKRFIQGHYDGFAGKLTGITGILTGHEVLAGYVFKPKAFDLRGCKRILDAGCGNGRYSKFILKQADPDAFITGFDLSHRMLKRARRRIPNSP